VSILSGQSIRKRGIVSPFNERLRFMGMTYGVGPSGYDVRIAEDLVIQPGGFALASTLEKFEMPGDVLGVVHDKSTWARLGLALQNTVIEPGWRGFLTLELTNHGPSPLSLFAGQPIAQIIFQQLDESAERPYSGKYQDQTAGPQRALFDH
jgi:dCTP deaminase